VAPVTNRLITAIAPAIGAEQTSIDVSSAYYHGTPDPIEAGGRYLFARIPGWLTELFPDKYPSHDTLGRPNILRIPGNMPGASGNASWARSSAISAYASSSPTAAHGHAGTTPASSLFTITWMTHASPPLRTPSETNSTQPGPQPSTNP
jgi:hypothetical protein